MTGMTFRDWLDAAKVTDDPAGDFVADARRAGDMPLGVTSETKLVAYLGRHHACPECVATVPEVWRRYRRWQRTRSIHRRPHA